MMEKNAKIYVAGHRGLVGSSIVRALQRQGYTNLITRELAQLDLINQAAVGDFFKTEKPEYVFLAAAKVGGIMANATYPADFIYQNLAIQTNVIHAAHASQVKKLLFLGSSCIYPKLAPQPMSEESLLTGPLEETNEAYAIAKIAGLKMCGYYKKQYGDDFISCMPTNLYGPGDNFNLQTSHVLPALIRKFHEAKTTGAATVTLWGTGSPLREFLFVDDLADACVFLMNNYSDTTTINVGSGHEVTIAALAQLVKDVVGFVGEIVWDASKPDGTPRKRLDVSKLNALGWEAKMPLRDGIAAAYEWFQKNQPKQ